MPRKPRKRPARETGRIEIERNVIEKFLMNVKEYLRKNRMIAIYAAAGLLAAVVVVIVVIVLVGGVNSRNERRYEIIMRDYEKKEKDEKEEDSAKIENETIKDLKEFIDSTHFGFTRSMAHYTLGNIYFKRKEYQEAEKYLVSFADREPRSEFAPIALLKAAVAMEESNNLEGARELYRRLEDRYSESILADQIFYNYARVCAELNDRIEARKYYNRVISAFPESAYVQLAKKRLFVLGPQ
ncbi:MAG: tetratricopeptide repeat protein [Spirochaetes bacterium]|nr:tetratricopeptide repeat protein [Spirochaetota bacterium]